MIKKTRTKSIATNVTRSIMCVLLIALLVLMGAAYLMVSSAVRRNTEKTSEQLVTMFADDLKTEYEVLGFPITVEHPEIAIRNGDDLCAGFDIDYAFVIVPEPEKNRFTYISVSCKDKKMEEQFENHYVGHVSEEEYSQGELDLWNGKEKFSHVVVKKSFGHEMITETIVEDSFGNRVSVGVDVDNTEIYGKIYKNFAIIGGLLILVMAAVSLSLRFVIARQVSVPARKLSAAMQSFVANGSSKKPDFGEMKCDEYEMIADAFGSMSKNINDYIDNIESLTRESERRQTELDIASKIQAGFLPEGRLTNEKYSISAIMKPAKEVAGDLYDYSVLDEDRVLVVIADVSGKGIGASLFMAVTLTLIRQFAKLNLPPDEILKRTNDALISNNPGLYFVTAFVGIYDYKENVLTYSNAGHCIPYVLGPGIRKLTESDGIILGIYGDEEFTCAEEPLSPGEKLFLYTDGVTEALNKSGEMFGEQRIENVLEALICSGEEDIVSSIETALEEFTEGCEQRDDITIASLKVN